MKYKIFTYKYLILLFSLSLLVSCAPEVTFHVVRPPKLPVKEVKTISVGEFKDLFGENLGLPAEMKGRKLESTSSLKPKISGFHSNQKAADLVRAMLISGLSARGQYRLYNTNGKNAPVSGVVPDKAKTGVINAKVKYYEYSDIGSEESFYLLMATKGGGTVMDQLKITAIKEAVAAAARKSKKGHTVITPYEEKIAAMEVTFDLIRKSDGQPIVPSQVFRGYYVQKWGGNEGSSHLPNTLRKVIVTAYQSDMSLLGSINKSAGKVKMALSDPDEFLASGGKLKNNPSVPDNSLDIQTRLAGQIVEKYLKMISRYTIETKLSIASGGDSVAVNYMKGNAYELAINRLESLRRTEDDSFNLALAYESLAEYLQAAKYYREALDKDPGNEVYKKSLARVSR